MIKSYLFYKTISRQGNELEQFLLEAFILSKFVQLTLKNNKVYVGFVVELRGPKENNYVKILPVISGYRDSLNKILRFTTPYFEAIKFFNKDKNSDAGDLRMIIKQNEILTASFFDPKIYHKINPPISAQQSR